MPISNRVSTLIVRKSLQLFINKMLTFVDKSTNRPDYFLLEIMPVRSHESVFEDIIDKHYNEGFSFSLRSLLDEN